MEKTLSDTIITVHPPTGSIGGATNKFHIEMEIESGGNIIVLRVFDYAYQDALKYKITEHDRIILEFPKSKVIFLDHTKNMPNEVTLELRFGQHGSYEYKVPAMKFLEHSIEDLDSKKNGDTAAVVPVETAKRD